MSATPKPIKWISGRRSAIHGEVGGSEMFTISGSTDGSGDYTLETRLPLHVGTTFSTEGDAKAGAERMLATFVERITA